MVTICVMLEGKAAGAPGKAAKFPLTALPFFSYHIYTDITLSLGIPMPGGYSYCLQWLILVLGLCLLVSCTATGSVQTIAVTAEQVTALRVVVQSAPCASGHYDLAALAIAPNGTGIVTIKCDMAAW